MALVREFGEMLEKTRENIKAIPGRRSGGKGVYVLYSGSIPIYFGRGNIPSRIESAFKSGRRGSAWDHFSWYALTNPALAHDIESLLLRTTRGFYVKTLNRQNGKLS